MPGVEPLAFASVHHPPAAAVAPSVRTVVLFAVTTPYTVVVGVLIAVELTSTAHPCCAFDAPKGAPETVRVFDDVPVAVVEIAAELLIARAHSVTAIEAEYTDVATVL